MRWSSNSIKGAPRRFASSRETHKPQRELMEVLVFLRGCVGVHASISFSLLYVSKKKIFYSKEREEK